MLTITDLKLAITNADDSEPIDILVGNTFDVQQGKALGLVGESGSGKSMTLRCILGIEPPNSKVTGNIRLDGEDLLALSGEKLRRIRASEIAFIAQDPHSAINPVVRIERYLIEGMVDGLGMKPKEALDRARYLIEQVGIEDVDRVLKSYPHQLSGGMLQRVVIAGAIAGNPKLLLADEPTTALDVTTQAEVVSILDEMRREAGMSMIFVTHDLDLAAAVCDELAVMRDGVILETGDPEQIRNEPQHAYTRQLMNARPMLYPEGHVAMPDLRKTSRK